MGRQLSRTSASRELPQGPPSWTALPEESEAEDARSAQPPFLGKATDAADTEDPGSQEPSRGATGWPPTADGDPSQGTTRGLLVGRPRTPLCTHTHTPVDEWVGAARLPALSERCQGHEQRWFLGAVGGSGHQRGREGGQATGRPGPTAQEQGTRGHRWGGRQRKCRKPQL